MKLDDVSKFLSQIGIPGRDAYDLPSSTKRFPDGAHYRMEISGIEGPKVLEALIKEKNKYGVPVHRLVSIVQGGTLFDRQELKDFAQMAAEEKMEVIAVPGPRLGWDVGRQVATDEGQKCGMNLRGSDELRKVIADMMRMYECGIRGFMIVDESVMWIIRRLQEQGNFPKDVAIKLSVWASISSAAGAKMVEELGVSSFNVPSDMTVPIMAGIRQAVDIPMDFYIYTSLSFGGMNRFYEAAEVARCCAPVYYKIEPGVALSAGGGSSLYQPWVSDDEHIMMIKKKVKYAAIIRELVEENDPSIILSEQGPADLKIPVKV
ncbi:MAG TPA: hypothetical protein GXX34_06750 [Clostridia bacterium]|nr:hypothetical protein [Clostridia bacterium]